MIPLLSVLVKTIVDIYLLLCHDGHRFFTFKRYSNREVQEMRVLIIEDDRATAQSIKLMLQSEGFKTQLSMTGQDGLKSGMDGNYDIITLDIGLPDMNGFEVLKSLRVAKVETPIIILSGRTDIEDKVKGLGFGADDYITKPFHKDELVARINAVIRRSKGYIQSTITTGKLKVNLDAKTVEIDGQQVHLTGREYQVLELLSLHKGTTVTKKMFLSHLYGNPEYEPELKIIDVFIAKARRKLAAENDGDGLIETVWGQGYRLSDPE